MRNSIFCSFHELTITFMWKFLILAPIINIVNTSKESNVLCCELILLQMSFVNLLWGNHHLPVLSCTNEQIVECIIYGHCTGERERHWVWKMRLDSAGDLSVGDFTLHYTFSHMTRTMYSGAFYFKIFPLALNFLPPPPQWTNKTRGVSHCDLAICF
jgi:hypothetical protein